MCGIAGFCTKTIDIDCKTVLNRMIDEIHHRGPDDSSWGRYISNSIGVIGLGHKRLSIIDISSGGRQPMESASGNSCIVFNGEIYNYRVLRKMLEDEGVKFRTGTDTEVILNMYEKYGEDCIRYFNGMFAFAILDRVNHKVFAIRDRLGIRPFYYYYDGQSFVFASEVKSIFKYPGISKEVNGESLMEYVQSRYIKNPDTIFRNIRKLPPGYSLTFEDSGLQIKKYWDIEDFTKLHQMDDQSALEELERAMEESVKLRMISDVPFGAFLSGGLDSSLVVALMSQYSDYPVNTFSVGFNDPEHSELPYARTIADLFKTNHHELVITHKDIMDNLYEAVWHRDAPVSETADIPMMLLSKEAKKSVSVILTGEGSDEVFGGYPKYAYDHLAKSMVYRNLFKNRLASYVVNHLPYGFRKVKSAYNTLLEEDDLKRYDRWFASYRRENVTGLFSREYLIHHGNKEGRQIKIKGSTNLDMMLYYDIKYWLSDNLLERGDKMLMAGSIEGRLPFLDFNLVELAFRFDDRLKIRKMNRKFIIKRLAQKYIPEKIINRKKVGFYIPIGDWFRKDLKDFVYDHLLSSKFSQRGIFNGEEVKRIVDLHCGSKVNYEKEIWMLLNLEIWFRRFID